VVTNDFGNPCRFIRRIIRPLLDSAVEGPRHSVIHKGLMKLAATKHFAIKDTVGNCSVIDVQPSWASGMQLLGNKKGYSSVKDAQAALGSDCKGKIDRG
jgi:hypothetical protein